MTFAFGRLRWSPSDFWNATFYELSCAYQGYKEANDIGVAGRLTERDVKDLQKAVVTMKAQHPDGELDKAERKLLKAARGAR